MITSSQIRTLNESTSRYRGNAPLAPNEESKNEEKTLEETRKSKKPSLIITDSASGMALYLTADNKDYRKISQELDDDSGDLHFWYTREEALKQESVSAKVIDLALKHPNRWVDERTFKNESKTLGLSKAQLKQYGEMYYNAERDALTDIWDSLEPEGFDNYTDWEDAVVAAYDKAFPRKGKNESANKAFPRKGKNESVNWAQELKKLWDAQTVWAKPGDPDSGDENYDGVNFAVDNMWTKEEGDKIVFYFGAPYRKEVSVDDNLGTYQKGSFALPKSGSPVVSDVEDWAGEGQGMFSVSSEDHYLADLEGEDLSKIATPSEFAEGFYQEIGMQF